MVVFHLGKNRSKAVLQLSSNIYYNIRTIFFFEAWESIHWSRIGPEDLNAIYRVIFTISIE